MHTSQNRYGCHEKNRTSWISIGAQVIVIVLGSATLLALVYYSDDIASIARSERTFHSVPAHEWVEALQSGDRIVRRDAVNALGQLDVAERSVIEALTAALEDNDPVVRIGAEAALRRLSDRVPEALSTSDPFDVPDQTVTAVSLTN